ncbi:protein kinase, putative [Bodo saltans]|uniref:Protein kinase, putative n=1 Tax=Bodo saltans TaxID=75058 RepID=A0A0S4JHP9_BODSA|nr:protein kinase, putative [Bodo saltans]|eukprot:CUG87919.1 protein kinase, putative [Bodo saltans]
MFLSSLPHTLSLTAQKKKKAIATSSSSAPQPPLMPREIAARYRGWTSDGSRSCDPNLQYYYAFDDRLGGRQVFIKLCPRGSDDDVSRHAQHMAKMQIQVKHPRLQPFHECISTPKYLLSIAPAIRGGTLLDALQRHSCVASHEMVHAQDVVGTPTSANSSSIPPQTLSIPSSSLAVIQSQEEEKQLRPALTEHDIIQVIRGVLQALRHLHTEGIRYGSLHPNKIVFADVSSNIGDVMLSGYRGSFSVLHSITNPALPRTREDMRRCGLHYGAIPFLSPEEVVAYFGGSDMFSYRNVSPTTRTQCDEGDGTAGDVGVESDMWGVGVLTFLLLTGEHPFWGRGEGPYHVLQRILDNDFVPDTIRSTVEPFVWPPAHLTTEAIAACPTSAERMFREVQLARGSMYAPALDFIQLCLQRDPKVRLSADEALLHPWLTKVNPLEGPSERTIPKAARLAYLHPAVASSSPSSSWTTPSHIGRFSELLHDYVTCCNAAGIRLNTYTLSTLCHPGSWRDREDLVVDLTQSGCGAVGPWGAARCFNLTLVTLAKKKNHCPDEERGTSSVTSCGIAAPPPLRLVRLHFAKCDLHDASVTFMVQLLVDNIELIVNTLEVIDVSENPQLTHASGRTLLRLLAAWQRCRNRRVAPGVHNGGVKSNVTTELALKVDGTSIGPHLIATIQHFAWGA